MSIISDAAGAAGSGVSGGIPGAALAFLRALLDFFGTPAGQVEMNRIVKTYGITWADQDAVAAGLPKTDPVVEPPKGG